MKALIRVKNTYCSLFDMPAAFFWKVEQSDLEKLAAEIKYFGKNRKFIGFEIGEGFFVDGDNLTEEIKDQLEEYNIVILASDDVALSKEDNFLTDNEVVVIDGDGLFLQGNLPDQPIAIQTEKITLDMLVIQTTDGYIERQPNILLEGWYKAKDGILYCVDYEAGVYTIDINDKYSRLISSEIYSFDDAVKLLDGAEKVKDDAHC